MNVLSLFDGISIAQQALKDCGIEVKKYYASEIDKYAIQTTQKNFPNTIQVGTVVGLDSGKFKDIDLLIGGSPCQDLSIAKKNREGLKGQRSGLFYEYLRILNEVRPKYFILENVNSMPKEAKETITKELYGIEPIMINAALVSAQNRKRLFWVGKRVGERYEAVRIEQPEDRGILLKDILEGDVDEKYYVKSNNWRIERNIRDINGKSKCLGATSYKGAQSDGMSLIKTSINKDIPKKTNDNTIKIGENKSDCGLKFVGGIIGRDWAKDGKSFSRNYSQGNRIYDINGKSTTLSANGGGRGAKTGLYCISSKQEHATISENKSTPLVSAMGMGGGHTPMITEDFNIIRKLTPIECERLQSLPDNYTAGVSNTQRYKALGNGFNCAVIEHILNSLK